MSQSSQRLPYWKSDDEYPENFDLNQSQIKSPCLNVTQHPECIDYCTWHNNYFSTVKMHNFMTLIRYALPQRKLLLDPISIQHEKDIASKIFGKNKIKDPENMNAPMSLSIFCTRKDKGFTGEDMGISKEVCDELFPTPTDSGICLTKNLDIKEIMNFESHYNLLFEPEKQKSDQYIDSGSLWGEVSLVILTDPIPNPLDNEGFYPSMGVGIPRKGGSDYKQIKFHLHQSKELAQLYTNNDYDKSISPFILEANHEYFLKITPNGEITSSGFKALNITQRQCNLENEIPENSIFKIYTENNCKYECHVTLAEKLCNCIPWDFISNIESNECDIFGRSCFYNAIKNFTQYPINQCKHCIKECDYIKFGKKIARTNILSDVNYDGTHNRFKKHIYCVESEGKIDCAGKKGFFEFLSDDTGIFSDNGFRNAFDAKYGDYNIKRMKLIENMIIVHLNFMQPTMQLVDVKYSTMDKFAIFGGNYGIFAEITGCSLLGILNFCLLLFKLCISCIRKH